MCKREVVGLLRLWFIRWDVFEVNELFEDVGMKNKKTAILMETLIIVTM